MNVTIHECTSYMHLSFISRSCIIANCRRFRFHLSLTQLTQTRAQSDDWVKCDGVLSLCVTVWQMERGGGERHSHTRAGMFHGWSEKPYLCLCTQTSAWIKENLYYLACLWVLTIHILTYVDIWRLCHSLTIVLTDLGWSIHTIDLLQTVIGANVMT